SISACVFSFTGSPDGLIDSNWPNNFQSSQSVDATSLPYISKVRGDPPLKTQLPPVAASVTYWFTRIFESIYFFPKSIVNQCGSSGVVALLRFRKYCVIVLSHKSDNFLYPSS